MMTDLLKQIAEKLAGQGIATIRFDKRGMYANKADVPKDQVKYGAALAARKNDIHTLAIIPNASHNLKVLKDASDPGFAGPVAPDAIDQLQKWLVINLSRE